MRMLLDEGVDDLGFPLGPGVVKQDLTDLAAASLVKKIQPPSTAVLITYLKRAEDIVAFCSRLGFNRVQLHADISSNEAARLKAMAYGLYVMKSLVVRADNAAELEQHIAALSPHVDAFITDTYDPKTGQRGATGKTHDWSISARLVELSPRPVMLAGGLNAENVADAIAKVRPAGVDSHTGVEGPDGRKELQKVRSFLRNARAAFSTAAAT